MKVLFITHHYLTSNGGGSFASRAYINAFAEIADDMTLLYPINKIENVFAEINPKITLVPVDYNISKWKKLYHQFMGKVHRYFDVAPDFINKNNYDVIIFDTSLVSYRLLDLAQNKGIRTIVIHHNYQYEYFKDNATGLLRPTTLFWCKKYEGEAVRNSDLNLTLSPQDIELLSRQYNGGKKETFKLLGVFEYKQNLSKSPKSKTSQNENFVITGDLSARQTEESLIPWIRTYYPILKEVFPTAILTIAGKRPGERITQICLENNVRLIPSPESMDPIMEEADYYICPTSMGGGLKLRIMDGLKWGLPVVSHSVSCRGYELFVESGCMFPYSDKDSFKQSMIRLRDSTIDKIQVINMYRETMSFNSGVQRIKNIIVSCGNKKMI